MTAHLQASIGSAKSHLRHRIISTYQRAQRIIAVAQAGRLFPSTEALVTWLLDGLTDDAMPEQDRIASALAVRAMSSEIAEGRKAS